MFAIYSLNSSGELFHLSTLGDWRRSYPPRPSVAVPCVPMRFDNAADAVHFAAEMLIPALPDCVDSYISNGALTTVELLAA